MLNLIPKIQKKELRLEKVFSLIKNLSSLITATVIIITIFFVGNFWLLNKTLVETQSNILVSEINLSGIENLKEDILKFNNNLVKAKSIQKDHVNVWQLSSEFAELVPKGITINSLSFDFTEDENTISFQGTADNRDALLDLQDNLNQSEKFIEFNYPLGSLVEKENIDFIFEGQISL